MVTELEEFVVFSLKLFGDLGSMGLVDERNAVNFYDGKVRVVDGQGTGICTSANLIVGTINNNAAIHMLTRKVASTMIKPGTSAAVTGWTSWRSAAWAG